MTLNGKPLDPLLSKVVDAQQTGQSGGNESWQIKLPGADDPIPTGHEKSSTAVPISIYSTIQTLIGVNVGSDLGSHRQASQTHSEHHLFKVVAPSGSTFSHKGAELFRASIKGDVGHATLTIGSASDVNIDITSGYCTASVGSAEHVTVGAQTNRAVIDLTIPGRSGHGRDEVRTAALGGHVTLNTPHADVNVHAVDAGGQLNVVDAKTFEAGTISGPSRVTADGTVHIGNIDLPGDDKVYLTSRTVLPTVDSIHKYDAAKLSLACGAPQPPVSGNAEKAGPRSWAARSDPANLAFAPPHLGASRAGQSPAM